MPPRARVRPAEKDPRGKPQPVSEVEKLEAELETERSIRSLRLKARIALAAKGGMTFPVFCKEVLQLTLTDAQEAIASVVFDGQHPTESAASAFFGGFDGDPSQALSTVLVLCGRGSGKTRVFIAARALFLALTVNMDKVAPGEAGLVPIVAPDQRQSRHSLRFVKAFLEETPLGDVLKMEDTLDVVRIVRPDGHPVTIEARPATGGGKAVRGPSLLGVLMEECAFFYGEGYEVSDEEIYRAARPRLLKGGQIVLATTPWAQSGLVWDLYRESFGHPKRAIVAKAPTLAMRPDPDTEAMVRLEREADPDNAAREFDADFLSGDAERFFPEPLIERCIDYSLSVEFPREVPTGARVRFGADFAFDADHSALFGLVEELSEGAPKGTATTMVTCALEEKRPLPGAHLIPSEVVKDFADVVRSAGGKLVVADAHYRRSIEEELAKFELALVPPPPVPAESFMVTRALMAAGRVKIPNHHRLLAQLRRVRASHKPGGVVTIHQPRAKDGGHGDIVSAMVCALSGVSLTATRPADSPKTLLEAQTRANEAARAGRFKEQSDAQKKDDARFLMRLRRTLGPLARRGLERLGHV